MFDFLYFFFLFPFISKKTSSPQGVIVESENEEDKVDNIKVYCFLFKYAHLFQLIIFKHRKLCSKKEYRQKLSE